MPLLLLVLVFIVLPIAELYVIIQVGQAIGALPTIAILVADSVIGSWLLDLTAQALAESPGLEEFSGRVSDSGEGRWTSIAAIEEGVPAPVLTEALYSRFGSRGLDDFANRVLSAQRKAFGGHDEKAS